MALPLRGEMCRRGTSTGMSCKAELEDQEWYRFRFAENHPDAAGVKRESYFWNVASSFPLPPSYEFQVVLCPYFANVKCGDFLFGSAMSLEKSPQKPVDNFDFSKAQLSS